MTEPEIVRSISEGRLEEAERECRRILAESPDSPSVLRLLGAALLEKGQPQKALRFLSKAAALAPECAEAHANHALALMRSGDGEGAENVLRKCLALRPDSPQEWNTLGALLMRKGDLDGARDSFRRALEGTAPCPEAASNLAGLESDAGRCESAERLLRRALEWNPSHLASLNNLGSLLARLGRHEEAAGILKRAVAAHPLELGPRLNLAVSLSALDSFEEAHSLLKEILKAAPEMAAAHLNLGILQGKLGLYAQSSDSFRKAVSLDGSSVDAHVAFGNSLLRLGRLSEGWAEWEWRLKLPALARIAKIRLPRWDREESGKNARALVHCEQGFGDAVQFSRFIPALRSLCGKVSFVCRPPLLPLFDGFPGIDDLIPDSGIDAEHQGADCWTPLMSLAATFAPDLDSIPPLKEPYIRAPEAKALKWGSLLEAASKGAKLKAGLCWAGSPTNTTDRIRSMRLADAAPLLKLGSVEWHSLQKGPAAEELKLAPPEIRSAIRDLTPEIEDFGDTAALISHLDLVVSVDTSVAHLAGAMFKPTLLALPVESEWRWLVDRDDSPWYPSMRIFRQTRRGDWSSPVAAIAAALSGSDIPRSLRTQGLSVS